MKTSATVVLALPMLLGGFVQCIVSQYYQNFATDTLLLDSLVVGAIFFTSRATDAILDPVCGYWSDRLGKRRVFIGVGLITLAGGLIIAFLPALSFLGNLTGLKYVLAAVGIFTLYLGVTLVYIPHYAWLAALQRTFPKMPFFASRVVIENIGTIFGGLALLALVPLQQKSPAMLFYTLVGILIPLVLLGVIPVFLQNDPGAPADRSNHSFKRSLAKLIENRRFALVAAMSFFNQFAAMMLLAVSLFYADYVLENKQLGVTLSVVFLLSMTFSVPIWSYFSRRFDRLNLWLIALIAIIGIFPTALIAQAGYAWYLTVFAGLIGAFAGAVILFVPQEVAFTTGRQGTDEGLYFAAFTFVNKSAMACAPLVLGLGLKLSGHFAGSRAPLVLNTITFLFVGVPALAFILSAILLKVYTKTTRAAEPM